MGGMRMSAIPAAFVSGDITASVWEVTLSDIDFGISAVQARAVLP